MSYASIYIDIEILQYTSLNLVKILRDYSSDCHQLSYGKQLSSTGYNPFPPFPKQAEKGIILILPIEEINKYKKMTKFDIILNLNNGVFFF